MSTTATARHPELAALIHARVLGEKQARSIGLSTQQFGAGPQQMEEAIRHFSQAKALGTPTHEELTQRGLSRDTWDGAVSRISRKARDRFSDARASEPLRAALGAVAGGATGYAAAHDAAPLDAIGATVLGAGVGGLVGRRSARITNGRLIRALRVLQDRGVLNPEQLRRVAPILRA